MNIELGKEIFKKCNGNNFVICREYGNEYKKCKVPKEYELIWLEEIRESFRSEICVSKGKERYSAFLKLCDIITFEEALKLTISILSCNLDLFERLLYVEYLKQLNNKKHNDDVNDLIKKNKVILESNINDVVEHAKDYFVLNFEYIEERISIL